MKIKIYLIIGFTILVAIIIALANQIISIKEKNNTLISNQEILLAENERYRIMDSISVMRICELNLTIDEYKKYRAEDQKIIDKLNADKVNFVEKIITETKVEKEYVPIIDTVFVHKTDTTIQYEKLKAFNYNTKWTDITGIITKDSVVLDITNREELIIVESLQKKKFWFIKLPPKIFGYKSKKIDVLSKNPNTQIKSAEVIRIE